MKLKLVGSVGSNFIFFLIKYDGRETPVKYCSFGVSILNFSVVTSLVAAIPLVCKSSGSTRPTEIL